MPSAAASKCADMPTVRAIIRTPAKNDNKMSSFILGVVNSARVPDGESRVKPAITDAGSR